MHTRYVTNALIIALSMGAAPVELRAATLQWPGVASCSGTLQACVNAAVHGDRVEIATNSPIPETVSIFNRNISLVAANGYHPRFAAGNNLDVAFVLAVNGPSSSETTISNIALDGGCFTFLSDVPGVANISDLEVHMPDGGCSIGIRVQTNPSPGNSLNTVITLDRNRVATSLSAAAGVAIFSQREVSATLSDNLVDSQSGIPSSGPLAFRRGFGISHSVGQGNYFLYRNQVLEHRNSEQSSSRLRTGLFAGSSGDGALHLRLADNAFRTGTLSGDYGIQINAFGGSIFAEAFNNTLVTDGGGGIAILKQTASPVAMSLNTFNNVFATSSSSRAILADPIEEIATFHDYNLLDGSVGDVDIGPHSIVGPAGFVSSRNWHLTANSIARDAGNASVRPPGLPALDGDGMRRVRGVQVDIGAFEYGDQSFTHVNPTTQSLSPLNRDSLNQHAEALLHITRSDDGGGSMFLPNARAMSQSYDEMSQRWNLRSDDGQPIAFGSAFSLFQPERNGNAGTHVATLGTIYSGLSALPEPWASLGADALFFVSATRGASLSNVANAHPFGASYFGGGWYIANTDGSVVPTGTAFTIYAQPPSRNAYVHQVRVDNTPTPVVSFLDHPELNGRRCALPHVSINGNGQMPAPQVTVRYDSGLALWYLLDETPATQFNFGNRYNILVDPRLTADACAGLLFDSSFE